MLTLLVLAMLVVLVALLAWLFGAYRPQHIMCSHVLLPAKVLIYLATL
jgi:hypothetical protein